MHLVNDDLVSVRYLPPLQGLYAGDLYRAGIVGKDVIRLDDANIADAFRPKHLDRLVDQRQRRNDEDRPLASRLNAPEPICSYLGFAGPRWRLSNNAVPVGANCRVNLIEQIDLVRTKVGAHATSASIGWKSAPAKASARIASIRSSPRA